MSMQSWKYYQQKLPKSIERNLLQRNITRSVRSNSTLITPNIIHTSDKFQFDYNLIKNINTIDNCIKIVSNVQK